jgi:hypothetical protein
LDEPNSFKRRLRCAAALPAGFENSPVANRKEFSDDITVPGDVGRREINAA